MSMRVRSFDLARGVAIFCVVLMHNTLNGTYTPLSLVIGSLLHNAATVGVPVFFFLSGYLVVFDRQTTIGPYMCRKIDRVLIPAWCWTIIFWLLLGLVGSDRSFDLRDLLVRLFFMTDPSQYYFVFVLMLLYPVAFWSRNLSPHVCFRLAMAMFAINLVIVAVYELLIWRSTVGELPAAPMYRNPLVWSGFFFYGFAVGRGDPTMSSKFFAWIHHHLIVSMLGAGLLLITTSLETFYLFWKQAPGGQDYFKVASFGYELIALHLLLIGAQWIDKHDVLVTPLLFLGKYSFFIYLVHMPLVPKLIQTATTAIGIVLPPALAMFLGFVLSLGLPIALALLFTLGKGGPWMRQRIGRSFGIPI